MGLLRPALLALAMAVSLPFGQSAAAPMLVSQADTAPDEIAWSLIRDSADPAVFERFLAQFPTSLHATEAREKLAALSDLGGDFEAAPQLVPAEPDDIALSVQTELKRVGCYRGALDGDWGAGSRRALADFGSAARLSVGTEPTSAVLNVVQSREGQVCTAPVQRAPAPQPRTPAPVTSCFQFNGQTFCE